MECDTSSFVLPSQGCFGYLGSFVVPYKFQGYWFCFYKKCHWSFVICRKTIGLVICSLYYAEVRFICICFVGSFLLCIDIEFTTQCSSLWNQASVGDHLPLAFRNLEISSLFFVSQVYQPQIHLLFILVCFNFVSFFEEFFFN